MPAHHLAMHLNNDQLNLVKLLVETSSLAGQELDDAWELLEFIQGEKMKLFEQLRMMAYNQYPTELMLGAADEMEALTLARADLEAEKVHYRDQWSEVCNENQTIIKTLQRIEQKADTLIAERDSLKADAARIAIANADNAAELKAEVESLREQVRKEQMYVQELAVDAAKVRRDALEEAATSAESAPLWNPIVAEHIRKLKDKT